jgi:hypothetical protein
MLSFLAILTVTNILSRIIEGVGLGREFSAAFIIVGTAQYSFFNAASLRLICVNKFVFYYFFIVIGVGLEVKSSKT